MRTEMMSLIAVVPLVVGVCGCPRVDDALEPNDTAQTASPLVLGEPLTARVVQGSPDVFAIAVGPGETLIFTLESLGEEECAAFTVTGPSDVLLYADQAGLCSLLGEEEFQVDGASLTPLADFGYELRVPAEIAGDYFLTIVELGQADNIFTFSWHYRLTVNLE